VTPVLPPEAIETGPDGPPDVPPEVIVAGPVILARSSEADAGHVARAVGESLEHLGPWMPWATVLAANESLQADRLRGLAGAWTTETDHIFELRLADGWPQDRSVIGALGMHRRAGPGAIELGYWLHVDYSGRGLMTTAVAAATAVALGLAGVNRVEIHTDEANARSAAIPARLGYRLVRVDPRAPEAPGEVGRLQIWVTP
jgi:RimJ/RimL family protein N-acetyltransferase